jgi:hypothetical protein
MTTALALEHDPVWKIDKKGVVSKFGSLAWITTEIVAFARFPVQ